MGMLQSSFPVMLAWSKIRRKAEAKTLGLGLLIWRGFFKSVLTDCFAFPDFIIDLEQKLRLLKYFTELTVSKVLFCCKRKNKKGIWDKDEREFLLILDIVYI